ncbi:hypothetical protein [Peribacillus simplex]|uniref:hypothetical protein n=1 Tax=Peribacillus simplex TaxID=1478 RepID=UPI001628918D|nr:hypothetical protein [Peribacillus simplex]
MATRVRGSIPDSNGLSYTVKVPTASEVNPVEAGATLSWNNVVAFRSIHSVGSPCI